MNLERKHHPSFPPDSFGPYTELDLRGYWIFLKYLNQEYIESAQGLLESVPLSEDQCIVLLGSDGKRERHAQSKTDIAIVQRSSPGNLTAGGLIDWFNKTHIENFNDIFDLQLHDEPEVKTVGDAELFLSDAYPYKYAGADRRIYPDRMLNTVFLLGNQDVHIEARRQVLKEMTNNGKKSGAIRRELVKQLKTYRRVLETGLYRGRPTYTENPPVQHYDEDPEVYSTGFKIGFLRTMQRFLDIAVIVGIREGFFTVDEAVSTLPTSCPERIEYLSEKGLFQDDENSKDAIDSYLWFLQQYHYVQELYKRKRTKTELPYDQDAFKMHKARLDDFTSKGYYSPKRNFLTK